MGAGAGSAEGAAPKASESPERRLRTRLEDEGGRFRIGVRDLLGEFGFSDLKDETAHAVTTLLAGERVLIKPPLATREVDQEVTLELKGPRLVVTQAFETAGKALGALAGLAVFVYLIGGLTVLARLERLELSAEATIPKIPKERLALLGLSQLLTTLVIGGLIAALAFWLLPARAPEQSWKEWMRCLPQADKRKWIPAVILIALLVSIAPASANGYLYIAILVVGSAWFVGYWRRVRDPVIPVLVALVLAGMVTVLRQLEFPLPFTTAKVGLTAEAAPRLPQATATDDVDGRVIETTDEEVLLAYESPEQNTYEETTDTRQPPTLLVLPRDAVEWIDYELPNDPQSHSEALIEKLLPSSIQFPVMCLVPICEEDTTPDEEKQEKTWGLPFIL